MSSSLAGLSLSCRSASAPDRGKVRAKLCNKLAGQPIGSSSALHTRGNEHDFKIFKDSRAFINYGNFGCYIFREPLSFGGGLALSFFGTIVILTGRCQATWPVGKQFKYHKFAVSIHFPKFGPGLNKCGFHSF